MIDSSPDGLDLLHRRLSSLLGAVLNAVDLSRPELMGVLKTCAGANIPLIQRPEQDGHELLVGAAASVVHDWWLLEVNQPHYPTGVDDAEWSDDIVNRASTCYQIIYAQARKGSGKTIANIDLTKPLGIGLTPDGTVLRTGAGGQGETNGVQIGSQIVSVDGAAVANLNELKAHIATCKADGKTNVKIVFFALHDDTEEDPDLAFRKKFDGPLNELMLAEAVHEFMLQPVPFDELSVEEAMKDLVAVRVCRLIIQISLSPTDHVSFEPHQPALEPVEPEESEGSEGEDVGVKKEGATQPLQFRKGPPPETPPRASFDELDVSEAVVSESRVESLSDVESLIGELVESGDSLRLRADKCADGSNLQQRLLGESERA